MSENVVTVGGSVAYRPYSNFSTENFKSGKTFYVDPVNGNDARNGQSWEEAFLTLTAAEDACTANQHDTVMYYAGSSSLSLTSTLVWDKNYTHLIGVCAPTRTAQRSRIMSSGNTITSLMTISATGCIFKNIYMFNGSSAATTYCTQVTGGRNYFENVHFAGMGNATPAAAVGSCSLFLNGAEENTFVNCTIGLDTAVRGNVANTQVLMDGNSLRNRFVGCDLVSASTTYTTPLMVKLVDTTATSCYTIFRDCLFYHFSVAHGAKLAAAFSVPPGTQTHDIILKDCWAVGITEWEANDRGQIWTSSSVPTAEDGGMMVEPINT